MTIKKEYFTQIKKRDGRIVNFDQAKITRAIHRAFAAIGKDNQKLTNTLSSKVTSALHKEFDGKIPSIEQIQDIIIDILAKSGHKDVAEAYSLYRQKRTEIREAKWWLLAHDVKTKLTLSALRVLESRYLKRDENGKIIETSQDLFRRVATNIALGESFFKPSLTSEELFVFSERFYRMMASLDFLPNSPTLMNAGNRLQQLSACFVLPVGDSMGEIFEALKSTAFIHQTGGGTGFSFSRLRPKGDLVRSTQGFSSGPVSFMSVFDAATNVIVQGGKRRGANMGILKVNHPDILEFITCKEKEGKFANFNISVAITDEFMEAVKKDKEYELINPRNGQVVKKMKARKVFDLIIHYAWSNGEPGVIFIDRINEFNPTPELGEIESTNPCVIGDTLVAVADGRNYVSIAQLAKEGKDVPVYCYGDDKVQIRTGRNPRKTRSKAAVWKVILDDGSYIIATKDHKFRNRDNQEIRLKDLKPNTSLMPFYKFQYKGANKRCSYWGIVQNNGKRARAEHRMIAEFFSQKEIAPYPKQVVHHMNMNGLDNVIGNLTVMSHKEHSVLHQTGEQNVMKGKWWDQLSISEKKNYREKMSLLKPGRGNGTFGRKHKNSTKSLISLASTEYFRDPKNRKTMSKKLLNFYQAHPEVKEKISIDKTLYQFIQTHCSNCGISFSHKENTGQRFCSRSCAASYSNSMRNTENVKSTKFKRRCLLMGKLYGLGVQFLEKYHRLPSYKEFKKFAKTNNLSGDLRSTFGGFRNFKEDLSLYNHKVVSVDFCGYQDVYNITVDDFHTVVYVTNPKTKTKFTKKPLISGIITSNCGEQPLLGHESCNLGSINLTNMVKLKKNQKGKEKKYEIDWDKLKDTVQNATRFLDNVIDMNRYPLPQIEQTTRGNRKIGLGVMGFANMLFQLMIPYNSKKALKTAEQVMKFIRDEARDTSVQLAKDRGVFPNFRFSIYNKRGMFKLRNATLTTIAPTGSIGVIAGCTPSIEPEFALAYKKLTYTDRDSTDGELLTITNLFLEKALKERGVWSKKLAEEVAEKGSVQDIKDIPNDIKKVFVTALDIKPEDHIKMQAAFQKYVDNATSKTINFPNSASEDDVKKAYLLAFKLGCKGLTLYRNDSRKQQALNIGKKAAGETAKLEIKDVKKAPVKDENDTSDLLPPGSCPTCNI